MTKFFNVSENSSFVAKLVLNRLLLSPEFCIFKIDLLKHHKPYPLLLTCVAWLWIVTEYRNVSAWLVIALKCKNSHHKLFSRDYQKQPKAQQLLLIYQRVSNWCGICLKHTHTLTLSLSHTHTQSSVIPHPSSV